MKHGSIHIRDNRLVIESPPHVSIRLRRLFGGAQRYKAGVFLLAATPEHAYDLEWFRERHPLDIHPGSEDQFRALVAEQEKKLAAIAEIDVEGYVPREFELALPPREYQRVAADLAIKTGALLIADDLGVGKSCSCICVLTAPGALPALVVTQSNLVIQWEREIKRFAPSLRVHRLRSARPYSFSDVRIEVDPTTKRRKVVKHNGAPDVIVTNYEKVHGWVEHLSGVVRTMICDEAQAFRHEGTRKYDAGKALSASVDTKVFATATPIYGFGEEIFNVLDVMAPGQLGTKQEFLSEWCSGVDSKGKAKVADPAALGSYLREAGLMIRRTRKDVGREIPPVTVVRHHVECDETAIDRVADDVAELARRIMDRIGTPLDRMQAARDIDYQMRQATGIAKAGATVEFVRLLVESGERVLLGGWHHSVYDLWCAAFDRIGITWARYTGKESEHQKDEARRKFVDGQASVLIMSNRSGAGLDGLQFACRTVVIAELDWSPQVIGQFIGRVGRDGQTDPVMAYVLVTDSGSDPVISDVLGIKEAQSHYLLNPDADGMPEFTGASDDHIRRLAEDVLKRRGRAA